MQAFLNPGQFCLSGKSPWKVALKPGDLDKSVNLRPFSECVSTGSATLGEETSCAGGSRVKGRVLRKALTWRARSGPPGPGRSAGQCQWVWAGLRAAARMLHVLA